ncbi:uncharacterized protein LOC133901603 [Phragmites australis]|uniref:uncharacterized protein LOC133901603 n=1 Tax=Phragmites australis TaxID=29695 RepID=UPI002D78C7AB|nr:uncharacterized protein LOC133901603 [Phragmites australis]
MNLTTYRFFLEGQTTDSEELKEEQNDNVTNKYERQNKQKKGRNARRLIKIKDSDDQIKIGHAHDDSDIESKFSKNEEQSNTRGDIDAAKNNNINENKHKTNAEEVKEDNEGISGISNSDEGCNPRPTVKRKERNISTEKNNEEDILPVHKTEHPILYRSQRNRRAPVKYMY